MVAFSLSICGIGLINTAVDLRVGENKFSGSIDVLSNLMNLESLHLASNKFSGEIADMFDQLFRLHELVLADNEFTGTMPRTLTHLQGLRKSKPKLLHFQR